MSSLTPLVDPLQVMVGVVGPYSLPQTQASAADSSPSKGPAGNAILSAVASPVTSDSIQQSSPSESTAPRGMSPLPPLKGQLPPQYADAVKAAVRRHDSKDPDGDSSGDSLEGGMAPIEEEDLGWGEEDGSLDDFSIDLSSLVVPQVWGRHK